jgi:hypothetical protein
MATTWKLSFTVLGENLFLMEFQYECDRIRVLEGRPWSFEKSLFVVEEFDGLSTPSEISFDKVAFWVRISNLPLVCMNMEIGKQIGAAIGEVEMIDTDEEGVGWGEFLRARIKLDITKPLLRGRRMKLGGNSIWARFQYEQLPYFCFECGVIKHGKGGCPKRTTSKVRRGEPEYGPWLRVPSPTRRFNTGSNSWRGRSSSNQQFGMESGRSASSNQKENEEDGHRTGTPVQSAQNNDGLASEGVSETPETHRGNHGIRSVMGESRDVVTRDLTLTKGKAVSVERERRSSGESTPQSKKMAAGLTGSINDGQSDMELEKEAAPAEEKRSMARINDSETLAAGVSATRNENSLSNKQRVHAFNACGDNNAQRNKISAGSMGRKLVSYVENMDLAPPQGKEALHLHSNLNEPDSLTPVSLPILSQPGLQLNESRGMQRKQGSS